MHVRISLFLFQGSLLCGLAFPSFAQDIDLIYPESVFPELEPLLERALEASPDLEVQRQQVEARRGSAIAQSSAARSRIDAYGNFAAGYEYRYNPTADDNPNDQIETFEGRSIADINASVWWRKSLFAWGNNGRREDMAEYSIEAGKWDLADATRQQLSDVREIFLRWCYARAQLSVAEENIAAAERFVDGQRRLLEIGETSEQAVLELEARLQQAEEVRAQAGREEVYFRRQLQLMTGDDTSVEGVKISEIPDFTMLSVEEISALRERLMEKGFDAPALQREEAYLNAEEEYYEIVRRDRRPFVDMTAGFRTDRIDSYQLNEYSYRLTSYAGIQVRWALWDGRRNEGDRMNALARRRGQQARLNGIEGRMRILAERTFADLELNVRQVSTRSTRVEMLRRRLALADNPDQAQYIAPFDLLELRLDLLEAQRQVLDAKVNYLMNMSRLAALFYIDPVAGV